MDKTPYENKMQQAAVCQTHGKHAPGPCRICAGVVYLGDFPCAPGLAACCQLSLRRAEILWPGRISGAKAGMHGRCDGVVTLADGRTFTCQRSITFDGVQWRRTTQSEHRFTATMPGEGA